MVEQSRVLLICSRRSRSKGSNLGHSDFFSFLNDLDKSITSIFGTGGPRFKSLRE